jgi:hypothetical protein
LNDGEYRPFEFEDDEEAAEDEDEDGDERWW